METEVGMAGKPERRALNQGTGIERRTAFIVKFLEGWKDISYKITLRTRNELGEVRGRDSLWYQKTSKGTTRI